MTTKRLIAVLSEIARNRWVPRASIHHSTLRAIRERRMVELKGVRVYLTPEGRGWLDTHSDYTYGEGW